MFVYDAACLRVMREVADEHGLVLVLDEIATGFGRTGTLLRRRGGRRRARRHVRRQGAHRRLPLAGRRAVHRRGRPRALRLGVRRADARPDVHGQPARLLGRAGQPRPAGVVRLVGQRRPGRRRARSRAGAAPRAAGCGRRAHDRRGRRGPARPPGRRGQGDRGRRRGGRVAAAVPRPRLRDAAVRHVRRGRGSHLPAIERAVLVA